MPRTALPTSAVMTDLPRVWHRCVTHGCFTVSEFGHFTQGVFALVHRFTADSMTRRNSANVNYRLELSVSMPYYD